MFKVGTLYQQRRGCGGATRINHWLLSKLLLSAVAEAFCKPQSGREDKFAHPKSS